MAKLPRCNDVGMDCDLEARAEREEKILRKVAKHAATAHDMKKIPQEVVAKVRAAIRDE